MNWASPRPTTHKKKMEWGTQVTMSLASSTSDNSIVDDDNDDVDQVSSENGTGMTSNNVLLEIVGIMGLASFARRRQKIDLYLQQNSAVKEAMTNQTTTASLSINSYCVVKWEDKEIHRTSVICNDESPIWTIETHALCLVPIPVECLVRKSADKKVTIEIWQDLYCLGKVQLSVRKMWKGKGERMEFKVQPAVGWVPKMSLEVPDFDRGECILSLRYREANDVDLQYLRNIKAKIVQIKPEWAATDVYSRKSSYQSIFKQSSKRKMLQHVYRVKPGPDPDRKDETEWMTKKDYRDEALKPSMNWVTAGEGSYGTLMVEVIGCDDLPLMDKSGRKVDPFVAAAFEDNMVRTDVIWEAQNPRWMPWTTRSFAFKINHPASLLMLAVFDYDETPLNLHKPIGRAVINTSMSNLVSGTTYQLHYKLYNDARVQDLAEKDDTSQGTITVRLQIEWQDPKLASKMSLSKPPAYAIHVDNEKAHGVLRYLTGGAVEMDRSSSYPILLYWREIGSIFKSLCYCLDVLWEVLLWRGRLEIWKRRSGKPFTVWFPVHSLAMWLAVAFVIEFPCYIAPVVLYAVSWILLSINYHCSRNPNPWKRVKGISETSLMMLAGRSLGRQMKHIEASEGAASESRLEKLNLLKQRRTSALIRATFNFMLRIYQVYSKTGNIKMPEEIQILEDLTYYEQKLLQFICTSFRRFRNFISWRYPHTCSFTVNIILLATAWFVLPINTILFWTFRILAWTLLGPLMKLVDIIWVQSWYRTNEQLLEIIDSGVDVNDVDPDLPDFDALLESEAFMKAIHAGRIKAEDVYKLKEMKKALYGKYCEVVPGIDNSRCQSFPLPHSSATSWSNRKSTQCEVIGLKQEDKKIN